MALISAASSAVNGEILILKSQRDVSLGKVDTKALTANGSAGSIDPLDVSTCRNRTNPALWELEFNVSRTLMDDDDAASSRMREYSIRSATDWNAFAVSANE
ncbi:hypothetical protein H0H93_009483 [Arthromyces matolae]|nr:hypothetical protein H0H93_009483 [Arthromyces matolae]